MINYTHSTFILYYKKAGSRKNRMNMLQPGQGDMVKEDSKYS